MRFTTTILVTTVAVLLGLGLIMLYSSSMNMEMNRASVGAHFLILQLVWCSLGLIGGAIAACTDYRKYKKFAPWLLGAAAFLLLLVFVPKIGVGMEGAHKGVNGAHRWIGFGKIRYQPSEFAKLALILFLAAYGDRFQRQMATWRHGIVVPGIVVIGILGLIFIEPDRGCTILLAAVSLAMLIIAGVKLSYIFVPAALGLAGFGLSLMHDPMRLKRLFAWQHIEESKDGVGYQAYQGMIALGAGGWRGLGLGNGRQKLGFIPEHHTDFIFTVVGEEMGLIVTLTVLLLFVVFVACGTRISKWACDPFGMLLGSGLTFMIGIQAFVNIGVVTGALPNKGMPLPFISYGGSNLMLMLIAVGILLSIARFAIEPVKQLKPKNPFELPTPELNDA